MGALPYHPMTIISVTGLRVHRGATLILDDISWQVAKGEHWVVLGANGSGKTSLLSCLTGYLTPSGGTVRVLDREYGRSDWRELRKRVGLVSSSLRHLIEDSQTALAIVASGRDAELNAWRKPKGALRAEALNLLQQVEAGALADRPWAYLSQGERQRTLIGRALMARHEILILDEPCAGLDPVARERFLRFVGRLAAGPSTPNLLLVTHHVEEILACFTRALLLHRGRALAQGAVGDVLRSSTLSQAFEAELAIRRQGDRYRLQMAE